MVAHELPTLSRRVLCGPGSDGLCSLAGREIIVGAPTGVVHPSPQQPNPPGERVQLCQGVGVKMA